MRGETWVCDIATPFTLFQSTPLMRGETSTATAKAPNADISIHSPHARGDRVPVPMRGRWRTISIHSPHARGDDADADGRTRGGHFNPLPSCEGRLYCSTRMLTPANFNPLPSCEGRPYAALDWLTGGPISIHSPHARGDKERRARAFGSLQISIHSPHARGDKLYTSLSCSALYFNPLPSCEGRLQLWCCLLRMY